MCSCKDIKIFILLLCYFVAISWAWSGNKIQKLDWCDKSLCAPRQKHVACNNNGTFNSRCAADAVMINLKPFRTHILNEHNKRRNFIASGNLKGYYAASRMATMIWDDELAYLATLNLKTCHLEHDDCNHTYRFRNVGQNLSGVYRYRYEALDVADLVAQSLSLWFDEYPLIDHSYISKFHVTGDLEKYGHFAELVVDRNTHVGCALMRFTNPRYPFLYIYNTACNYASVYALDMPVYRMGEPASACKTGTNPFYPALCSINEPFNPNYTR